jgi:hypothetical protein
VLAKRGYFGRMVGSPPGLPGGGITGVLPVSGVGARICGSTPAGGHSTPSDRASLSASGSLLWPVVVSCGAIFPCGVDCVGAQLLGLAGAGVAIRAGGVAGAGGACALAAPDAAINTQERMRDCLIRMQGKRPAAAEVPRLRAVIFRICGSGSARNAPSAAWNDVRSG